ncbi:transposase family protein [Streptomyces sp. NBC_01136]|uniref:helix-turn-helix domain-containing protein n=1 Tax=unclassified Streptomyces TaxID=2593676 RepID=UPI0032500A68|nr:transposase family protein [Streptomyces sp. NBC_01136]
MNIKQARAAMSHPAFCGLSRQHLGELIEELAPRWEARCESVRRERRRSARRRQAGAGPKYELVFTDRVFATSVHPRTGLSHEALAVIYEVDSSTIGRAISEIRPLLAERGFAVPDRPGIRLRTLADVFAYAAAENITLRIDGTETQVRRPKAHCPGRRAFVSGKRRQNTPTRSTGSGAHSSGTPGAGKSTARPTGPSPDWSLTARPSGPPCTSRAPNSSSSAPWPAEIPTSRNAKPTRPNLNRGSARKREPGGFFCVEQRSQQEAAEREYRRWADDVPPF